MSDIVEPSFSSTARSRTTSVAISHAGAVGNSGWVQPSSSRLVEDPEGNLTTGPLNAFNQSSSASSLDVTIDTGEALVRGAYLARDTQTTVSLAASTANQSVYVGWKDSAEDTVIVGLSSAFTSDDPKIEIWSFDTDATGVTGSSDQRNLDYFRISNSNLEAAPSYFGDGSDGSIARSSNQNENGVIQATDYTVNSGVTLTVSTGVLVVFAQDKITINGTIDATGTGANGGDDFGGAGGDGGGVIVLCAPEITGTGSLVSDGADGEDETGSDDGAGGGGAGGAIVYIGGIIRRSGISESVAGGLGGNGGDTGVGGGGSGGGVSYTGSVSASIQHPWCGIYDSILDLTANAGAGGGSGERTSDASSEAGDSGLLTGAGGAGGATTSGGGNDGVDGDPGSVFVVQL